MLKPEPKRRRPAAPSARDPVGPSRASGLDGSRIAHRNGPGSPVRRRNFLHLAAGAAALPAVSRFAWAQNYPARPVRIIVPFPAGQATDTIARLMGQSLSERLGQPFVIESAGGNIGTESVVRATLDGYTLLLVGLSSAMNETLYKKLSFNFIREIAPVASIGGSPYVMVINPSVPAKTVPEFIAYAKANSGKINMGSSGHGSVSHVFGERFKMMTGINLVHVPYRGGYLPDLLSGQVQVVFGTISTSIQYIRGGMLRALAVTTATRSDVLPDIPTLGEFLPGYEVSQWYGVGAPKDTPAEVIEKLNKEINAVTADPLIKARLAGLGVNALSMTSAAFGKFVADETEKWGKVILAADIKAD
jgi:tripartite-type tricarboxylate transporter receptor subunit TctC